MEDRGDGSDFSKVAQLLPSLSVDQLRRRWGCSRRDAEDAISARLIPLYLRLDRVRVQVKETTREGYLREADAKFVTGEFLLEDRTVSEVLAAGDAIRETSTLEFALGRLEHPLGEQALLRGYVRPVDVCRGNIWDRGALRVAMSDVLEIEARAAATRNTSDSISGEGLPGAINPLDTLPSFSIDQLAARWGCSRDLVEDLVKGRGLPLVASLASCSAKVSRGERDEDALLTGEYEIFPHCVPYLVDRDFNSIASWGVEVRFGEDVAELLDWPRLSQEGHEALLRDLRLQRVDVEELESRLLSGESGEPRRGSVYAGDRGVGEDAAVDGVDEGRSISEGVRRLLSEYGRKRHEQDPNRDARAQLHDRIQQVAGPFIDRGDTVYAAAQYVMRQSWFIEDSKRVNGSPYKRATVEKIIRKSTPSP